MVAIIGVLVFSLCNKQTFFVLFFVKLFVHFAGHYRAARADAEASALCFYRPQLLYRPELLTL